jgi:surfeit locus 1 family protein
VVIRNQAWEAQAGVHLLTPLIIAGSDQAVFINRGWIPLSDYQDGSWDQYAEGETGQITGQIRLSQAEPTFGGRPDPPLQPGEIRQAWNFINLEAIASQIPYPILPIYIQQAPDEADPSLPYRSLTEPELTEGSHLSYAGQWFLFAAILLVGYPIYCIRTSERGLR